MITPLNGKNLSLADIVLAGRSAGTKAFTAAIGNATGPRLAPDSLALQTVKLEEFGASGLTRPDFANWEQEFNATVDILTTLANQPAESVKVAAQTAAS